MRELHLDYETRSRASIKNVGAIRYTEDEDFMILMAGWAWDDEPVQVWDYTEGPMPAELVDALQDADVIHYAHNANFELAATRAHLGELPNPEHWRCTAVWGASLGLPRSLDGMAKALKLAEEKDAEGKRLIQWFCVPIAAGKLKGQFRDPKDHPEKWAKFREYCAQDVEVERAIHRKLRRRPMPDQEWKLWALDQRINFDGVQFDRQLAENAINVDAAQVARRVARLKEVTGLENPNSVDQFNAWLGMLGWPMDNLQKETVESFLASAQASDADDEYAKNFPRVKEALELRLEVGSKSTSKYAAMLRCASDDDRIRGLFQFYGADTGRWAGRQVQLQNLPRNSAEGEELDALRERLLDADRTLESSELKQLIRTALIPKPGHVFLQADFSAIEARVLAWLAREEWVLETFRGHGKIYEATAAAMMGKSMDDVTKDERQRGKVAVLALGYQGGKGALANMNEKMNAGLVEKEMPTIVAQWRRANPNIVKLWAAYERAARSCVGKPVNVGRCTFERRARGSLYVTLPSGRQLAYPRFTVETDDNDRLRCSFTSYVPKPSQPWRKAAPGGGWREDTYGGKLTENITQAVARDLLAESMLNLDILGHDIVATIHDEVLIEAPVGARVESIIEPMTIVPAWAQGIPLDAAGEVMHYFHK